MSEPSKATLREIIQGIIQDSRASGVPDEGVAEMLAQWTRGHLDAARADAIREAGDRCAAIAQAFANAGDTYQEMGAAQCVDQLRALLLLERT